MNTNITPTLRVDLQRVADFLDPPDLATLPDPDTCQRAGKWLKQQLQARCDGNHGAPRCADWQCWHDGVPADGLMELKAMRTAQAIEKMWGENRTQFVARIQIAVRGAMQFAVNLQQGERWIAVADVPPPTTEPVVYARAHPLRPDAWAVGIAYWSVSQRWVPEAESQYAPQGFAYYKPLGSSPGVKP